MRKSKRKWSITYKKSINCNRPKGFSQKQYCKYGGNPQLKKRITKKLRNEYLNRVKYICICICLYYHLCNF